MYEYKAGYLNSDLENWNQRQLRSNDQFCALCYAFGITSIDPCDTIEEQLDFLNSKKTRTPKSVLEIGAGRGEIACSLSKLGIPVTAVDRAIGVGTWFTRTGKHFFGNEFIVPTVIEAQIKNVSLDYSQFDTILMVESFEHITEEDFQTTWDSICKSFNGLFCITNHPRMHPIPIGSGWKDAEKQHCRIVDDALFDAMASQAKGTIFRKDSHFVLEF